MTTLTVISGSSYGASIIANGNKFHFSELNKSANSSLGLGVVWRTFLRFTGDAHCQIALDAGGKIVESETNKWNEVILKKVEVDLENLVAYCKKLQSAQNPHAGMMQTSTGEWVMADDWDIIEGSR